MDDVFCKIISGDIPSSKVYEDKDMIAILDISQVTEGHTLVIPKEHYENILECPKELLSKLMELAKKIGEAQKKALGAKGLNILTNVGVAAGQSVPHFHIHVIPRYEEEDGSFKIEMGAHEPDFEKMANLAATLKGELK